MRFESLGLANAQVRQADGGNGLPGEGPFDRIVAWTAFDSLPRPFVDQLSSGGIVIAPIGPEEGEQVLAGQAMMIMPGLAAALPHIRSQKLRPIAITGLKRHPLVPEVPTFEESGFKGYDGVQWYGIVGPAKLPDAVTAKLNAEINKVLASPDVRRRCRSACRPKRWSRCR